jgi:pimeloyl-ACP methyl ester carboxylesterase
MKKKKWLGWGVGVIFITVAWLVMAFRSGLLIPYDGRWASEPGSVRLDGFSHQKKLISLPSAPVAYIDIGEGPPLILLHGCPFSVYEWKNIILELAKHYRVIAPDLFGLGDTPVKLNQDYRLPTDVTMVNELMDALNIRSAAFIAHDHGGATLQLMMKAHAERIDKAIMTNIEAYDEWPSKPELPYLRAIVNLVTSPFMFEALQYSFIQRKIFQSLLRVKLHLHLISLKVLHYLI